MGRFGRWLTVAIVAWALRRGLAEDDVIGALRSSHPRHDWPWRESILSAARSRNNRKRVHA